MTRSTPPGHTWPSRPQEDAGIVLLTVLVMALVVAGSSAGFIWFMNQQQTAAGSRLRSSAARSAAEAGVHQALSFLETAAPDGFPSRVWRPQEYTAPMPVGGFEGRYVVSVVDRADGGVMITSTGRVGTVTRRLRARAYLASPALLAALYGAGQVRADDPSSTLVIVPYGTVPGGRPWVHIAAGQGLGLASSDVAINDPRTSVTTWPGPVDAPTLTDAKTGKPPDPVRLLLALDAELTIGPEHLQVDVQQLRATGMRIGEILQVKRLPAFPAADRSYLQDRARTNSANAAVNAAAGDYLGDKGLSQKRDSLYSREEFQRLQLYLQAGSGRRTLEGVIFVAGDAGVSDGQALVITDGALVTEGLLRIGQGAALEVSHSASSRTLPGVMVLDGTLVLTRGSRLRVHGLVYARRTVDLWAGSQLDVVGAVAGGDPAMSFRSLGGTALIRYDPAVLGTPGLRPTDNSPPVAWVAAWEELP